MSTIIDGIDYGPLFGLIGRWEGDRGLDVSPDPEEPNGIERNPFTETIIYDAVGDVENAQEQILAVVRYHQVVTRKSTGLVFHDQVGHWMYDKATGVIMHSLSIPRGVCLLAGGKATSVDGVTTLSVEARLGSADFGVVQSPFMRDKASTDAFEMRVNIDGDNMNYNEVTYLTIYGKKFDHRDKSVLTKVS